MNQGKTQSESQLSNELGFQLVIVRNPTEVFFFKNYYFIIPVVYSIYALLEFINLRVFPEALLDYVKIPTELALILALFFSNLFFREIPNRLNWLLSNKSIIRSKEDASKISFLKRFDRLLNHKRRIWLGLLTLIFALVYYVWKIGGISRLISEAAFSLEYIDLLLYIFPTVFYAYFVGIVVWKLLVTSFILYSIPNFFNVKVQFEHPDNAGGLMPIGLLSLSMIYVTVIPAIRSALVLVSRFIAVRFDIPYINPNDVLLFVFSPLILLAGIAGSIVALIPIFKFHSIMESQKERLVDSVNKLSDEIVELKQKLLVAAQQKDTSSCDEIQKQINLLEPVYKSYQDINTWPIDKKVLTKIWSAQAFLIAQVITLWNWVSQLQ